MLRGLVFGLVLTRALALQIPLSSVNRQQAEHHRLSNEKWSLDELPNPNATDHLVFDTVNSLLQHWPNTRMRNGHNIVPGRIPKGTLLYHGRTSGDLPTDPDWVATDPEHSYLFCRRLAQQGCWHLTLATTRPLKVIYFDGSGAAKIPYGSMDTQDLVGWGSESCMYDVRDDWQRIKDLCKWGKSFGVDGFMRMEMDFEVMLCDFTSGVDVVSFGNLVAEWAETPIASDFISFEVLNSGSWHNHFPGETRIQLDLTGLISFYDTQLVPSLVNVRAGQERWDHRVVNISNEDLAVIMSTLEGILTTPERPSSGIDWRSLVRVIFDRYAGRLELTRYLLNSTMTDPDEMLDLANKTQTQLRIMLTPYLLSSAIPTDESDKSDLDWTIPIYKLCATTHTSRIESEIGSMTDSEKLILQAVRGTTREICRVVTRMWAAGFHAGIDPSLNRKDSPDIGEVTEVWNSWNDDLERLMGWLDWSVWVKCNPSCGPEEMCYLPTWPVRFPNISSSGCTPPPPPEPSEHPELDDWIRPQPRCLRALHPYAVQYGLQMGSSV